MEITKISAALVRAQQAFSPALKTSTNPHFRSRYADLSACVEAVVDALNGNGVFLFQQTEECHDGAVVETVFLHESGERFSAGKLFVPVAKMDAQAFGSALTYARRYSLMAACGIAPEDDDGNAASQQGKNGTNTGNARIAITDDMKIALTDRLKELGKTEQELSKYMSEKLRRTIGGLVDLSQEEAEHALKFLKHQLGKKQ